MRYYWLLLSILLCTAPLTAQTENDSLPDQDSSPLTVEPISTPVPMDTATVSNFNLQSDGSQVIIVSSGLNGPASMHLNEESTILNFENDRAALPVTPSPKGELLLFQTNDKSYSLYHLAQKNDGTLRIRHIPLWLSIIPPLIAIVLALIFREVVVSLFVGVWVGAFIAGGMRIESLYYFFLSFLEVVQIYIINALNDNGHLSVLIFSLLIGGMVAIISRNGGMAGVVQSLTRYARSPKSSQFITWFLGVAIFFDDYANTLIVGNTMRSVTDKFKVSREKLAYIVDSTAAPVAAVAFITTWIGAELGYIDDGISQLDGFDANMTPYAIFISSLKYSFYPILTLLFILMLIYTQRDFGPMLKAEQRAKDTGEVRAVGPEEVSEDLEDLSPVPGAPLKWHNAVIPVAVVILMTIFGLVDTGITNSYDALVDAGSAPATHSWGSVWGSLGGITPMDNPGFFMKLGTLIGNADSYIALLWASLSGVTVALILTLGGRIMKLGETIGTLTTGFKTMLPALIILTLAWSLASTTENLHTATYLTSTLADSLNPYLLPVIIFILSALISFSTGSSWSTMAILYPIAIPTTWAIGITQGMEPYLAMELLLNVIAVTLAASVLGDHCSPISDTTILSSLASDCNHIDHVRTQLPYALTVGAVSLAANGFSTLLGGGWLICTLILVVSIALLYGIVLRVGKLKT